MNDRTLLELAARAYGLPLPESGKYEYAEPGEITPKSWGIVTYLGLGRVGFWNSLSNRGDALMLMARLNINVYYRENINGAFVVADHDGIEFSPESLDGPDECDATCRAITRAAAQLAQAMQEK